MCKLAPIVRRFAPCISNILVSEELLTVKRTGESGDSNNQANKASEPIKEPIAEPLINGGKITMYSTDNSSKEKAKREFEKIKLQIKGPEPFKPNNGDDPQQKKDYCERSTDWNVKLQLFLYPLLFKLDVYASKTVPVLDPKEWKDPICEK